jgi:hypothetical protein
MRTLFIILFSFINMLAAYPQAEEAVDSKTQKQLLKEEKKKQREIEEAERTRLVDLMVNAQRFVLEADYLSNQYGDRIVVSSTLNFIIVDSTQGTIQIASPSGIGGSNFMGGVTADGMITQYEVTKLAKSGGYNIKMLIMTSLGSYDIFISVTSDGYATATIGGNWGGKLNYHGRLVPLGISRIYKGRSI